MNESSRNKTRSLARLSIARNSSVMGSSMCRRELLLTQILTNSKYEFKIH
jgi:hypothetical protein